MREAKLVTHCVNVEQAMETLDHAEMIALAVMFERWALTEEKISADRRTQLIQWSADYEAIADHVGPGWQASNPAPDMDVMRFIARMELKEWDDRSV
jgi:hypothetical protein